MDLQFVKQTNTNAAMRTIDSIEQQIRQSLPVLKRIYIEERLDLAAASVCTSPPPVHPLQSSRLC